MATIVVINGRHQGEWYTIGQKPMTFGRDDDLLAEIIDPRVSRRHLQVRPTDADRYVAVDLNSHNGTKVNGESVAAGDEGAYPLAEGDVIQIGHTLLAFTLNELTDNQQMEPFIERMREKASSTLKHLEKRDRYSEAAALFSRLLGRR